MDQIWIDMYNAAKAVLGGKTISDYVTAGEVSAAVRSKSGKIYVGVCIDTCHTYTAGYDLKNEYERVWQEFDDEIGS